VVGPPPDGWEVEIDMLARSKGPRSGKMESYSNSFTREDFDISLRPVAADVSVEESADTVNSLFVQSWFRYVQNLSTSPLRSKAQLPQ